MENALVERAADGALEPVDPVALLLADKRSVATRKAYAADLEDFFGGAAAPDTVRLFLGLRTGDIALRLTTYRAEMLGRGLAPATINRRLSAVRSLLKMAYRLGISDTDGRGLVDAERVRRYRDTRGVDLAGCRRIIAAIPTDTVMGARNVAILRVMLELALRRAEVINLNVVDFEYAERRLMVTCKGRGSERAPMTISQRCADAIATYLLVAGHAMEPDVPLFRSCDRNTRNTGGRLHGQGLHHIIEMCGLAAAIEGLTPHKLRHSSITAALDATGGDVRRVQRLSRHVDLRTLTIYDDNRSDLQGEVTGLLAGLL